MTERKDTASHSTERNESSLQLSSQSQFSQLKQPPSSKPPIKTKEVQLLSHNTETNEVQVVEPTTNNNHKAPKQKNPMQIEDTAPPLRLGVSPIELKVRRCLYTPNKHTSFL